MSVVLRNYQDKVISDLDQAIEQGYKRNCIVLPTGAGKTIIGGTLIERAIARGERTLFVVHRKNLVIQTAKSFKKNFDFDFSFHTSELDYVHGKDCSIGMINTIGRRLEKFDFQNYYQNIICDEAHHAVSPTYEALLSNNNSQILGLTATPWRLDNRPLGDVFSNLIIGPTTKQLIELGALCKYRFIGFPCDVDFSKIKISAHDFDPEEAAKLVRDVNFVGNVIEQYKSKIPGKKTVAFFPTIESSQEYAARFNAAGIPAAHYDGTTPDHIRDSIDDKFRKGEILVLCNVNIVSEGYDVPDCEAVIMARPTQSLSMYLQQAGRALRTDDKNPFKVAFILDFVKNFDRFLLPDSSREWVLKSKNKSEQEDKIFAEPELVELHRRCWYCFTITADANATECAECGTLLPVLPKRDRGTEETNNLDLVEITEETISTYKPKITKQELSSRIEKCDSLEDLQALGRELGYKPGWAHYQFQNRKKYTNRDS